MKSVSFLVAGMAAAFLFSCQKADLTPENSFEAMAGKHGQAGKGHTVNAGISFYALGTGNRLDFYDLDKSSQPLQTLAITGIMDGEQVLAIDFRPATGQLYALGSSSRLYVVNLESGMARAVGAGPFSPMLSGELTGFDFNPTVDRIRVVTSSGQNLRLHPETGAVVFRDGDINGAPGAMLSGAAYTNNVAGAATTTLYDIDVAGGKLYKQDPPNNGTLVEVGSLDMKLEGEGGFDIAPPSGSPMEPLALALYSHNKKSTLYTIDLNTGKAMKVEKFEKDQIYYGIAIPTNPVAYAVRMNSLLIFNPANTSAAVSKTITGLQMGESIVGIDFRPATGQLYAIGSNNRIYTLNTSNGAAAFVATLSRTLEGTSFGVDFNPVPDRIRIVSNTGQNLRVHPETGAAIKDGDINPAPAFINAAAYTNNFAGTTTTTLHVIDSNNDMLYIQSPPNDGKLSSGKSLGINIDASNGFDIGGRTNQAYGIFTVNGTTRLYSIDLTTGNAMPGGEFSGAVSGFTLGLGF